MKADEALLLKELRGRGKLLQPSALEISEYLGIPYKRARYIFLKWTDKNWYEYGVSWRVGWLTSLGMGQFITAGKE